MMAIRLHASSLAKTRAARHCGTHGNRPRLSIYVAIIALARGVERQSRDTLDALAGGLGE